MIERSRLRPVGFAAWAVVLMVTASGCGSRAAAEEAPKPAPVAGPSRPFATLSQYALFAGDPTAQVPAEGVIPYDLNSALFSDYAEKFRFVKLPRGTRATYRDVDTFEFPVGTVIAKTFAYPRDARDPSKGRRLIETRILKREPDGWVGLPYIWGAAQTEATLDVAGDTIDVSWIHVDGRERTNNYIIPNSNQCKGCHESGGLMMPIGPKARHLNRDFAYRDGRENQLAHWSRLGMLAGAPSPADAPRLAAWDDPESGTLDARACAWLEINCAHCHNPRGPRATAGSTCSPASATRPPSASTRCRWPRVWARAGGCTISSLASPTNPSWRTGSHRPTRVS